MSQVLHGPGVQDATTTPARTARRDKRGAVERVGRYRAVDRAPAAPAEAPVSLEMTRNVGWFLTVLSAVGALVASWALFPVDAVGMVAGYWVSTCATIAILGAMWLRSYLSTAVGVAVTAVAGGVLLLLGALRDYPTTIGVTLVVGGAGIVVGALMQADRHGNERS